MWEPHNHESGCSLQAEALFRQMVYCSRRCLTEAGSVEGGVGWGRSSPVGGGGAPDSVRAIRTAMRGREEGGLGDREGQSGWSSRETAHGTA